MAGIYVHIPFCKQACHYCDFHFSTSLKLKDPLIEALQTEIRMRSDELSGQEVETVYFGGGTPSLLSGSDLETLLDAIRENYRIKSDAEITIEANPDDLNPSRTQQLQDLGINRLSIGIQSFNEEALRALNRAHSSREALEALDLASKQFKNITIDLIYGIPCVSELAWQRDLDYIQEFGIPHVSAYALTVEPKTALAHFINKGSFPMVDEDHQHLQYQMLTEHLKALGMKHYEVSNFAFPGWYSRHNSSYWQGVPYLGFGPSAHSFDGQIRSWNKANNSLYIKGMTMGERPAEFESLSDRDRFNEYLMTGLRTEWGISMEVIHQEYSSVVPDGFRHIIDRFAAQGLLNISGDRIVSTEKGLYNADGMASELFSI